MGEPVTNVLENWKIRKEKPKLLREYEPWELCVPLELEEQKSQWSTSEPWRLRSTCHLCYHCGNHHCHKLAISEVLPCSLMLHEPEPMTDVPGEELGRLTELSEAQGTKT